MIQKRYWKLRNVITNASTNKLAQQRNIKFFTPSWSRSLCVWHMPSRASSLKTKQVFLEPERHKKEKKKKGKRKAGPNPSVGSQKCEWYCDLPIATEPLLQKGLGKGWDKTKELWIERRRSNTLSLCMSHLASCGRNFCNRICPKAWYYTFWVNLEKTPCHIWLAGRESTESSFHGKRKGLIF